MGIATYAKSQHPLKKMVSHFSIVIMFCGSRVVDRTSSKMASHFAPIVMNGCINLTVRQTSRS
jgi:hypothetical protein